MTYKTFLMLALFSMLYLWVFWQLSAPAKVNEYLETAADKAWFTERINYHCPGGIVILKQTNKGWEFYRQGQWCRL